jgi:alpha-N-arabinofuranosidase
MRARDAAIKVIAVGAPGKWNDVIFPACARHMDLLSGHHYTERKTRLPFAAADARKFEQYFPAYSGRVAAGIRGLVVDFRKRLESKDANAKRVRLAIDEWGIVRDWNSAPDGPGIGAFEHYYCLGDAIAVARAMHEILRAADVTEMANWAQTVNVIGTIKSSRTRAVLDPAGHVLALYRAHLGGNLVPLVVPRDVLVDAVAARDTKRGVVTVGLVHFSPARHLAVKLRLAGLPAPATATAWRINGPELGATNVPGQPAKVTTTVLPEPVPLDRPIELPAHSITVLSVTAR